jgi:magnesium chelatase accessory protein
VLLHGTGSSAHTWADVVPALVPHATVVAPDLPGHGFTRGATRSALTLPRIAADLDGLLAALGLPRPALVVGHSAGAALGVRWALASPAAPRALLGFNPSLVPPPALYLSLLAPLVTPVATSGIVTSLLAALGARTRLVDGLLDSTRSTIPVAQRARYARLFADTAHVRGTMGFMAGADLPAMLRDAPRLAIPITFVLGAGDPWVPERPLRRVIAQAFPQAELLVWPGGHLLHETEPARAAALILATLERAQPQVP